MTKNSNATPSILCLQHGSIFESYGGIEYYLHDLMTLLGECAGREDAHAIIPVRSPKTKIGKGIYEITPVRFSSFPVLRKLQNRFSLALFRAAWKVGREKMPDAVLAGHVSLAPMAYALSKLLRVPYYTVAYGIEVWGDLWPQDEWALRRSQGIISISEWTKKVLVDRGYPADKIDILHPMVAEAFEGAEERVLSSEGPLRLLSISRLDANEKYKGQDHVLEALGQLKQSHPEIAVKYTIVGDGTDKSRLVELTSRLRLTDSVSFEPAVKNRTELISLYRRCDVFILPSRYGKWEGKWRGEGFGIVYAEAGMLGVPSIAYESGGVTDIISNQESTGWLVPPDDIAKLASTIRFCAENRDEIGKRGELAKTAMKRFSKVSVKDELIRILRRITHETHSTLHSVPDTSLSSQ